MSRPYFLQEIVENVINNYVEERSLREQKKYKYVISDAGKRQLKQIKYNSTCNVDICTITLNKFEENEILIQLPCNHIFSKDAILQWLENEHAHCPMCKYKLDAIKKEVEEISEEDNNNNISTSTTIRQMNYIRLPSINIRHSNRIVNYDDIVLGRALRNSLRDY